MRCSNKQAEQLAILKALENLQFLETNDRTALIYTDSRITLESLKNRKKHTYLIETIRKKVIEMENQNWIIEFNWIKTHAGHHRNELAEQIAKEAANNSDTECYKRIPKSIVRRELSDYSVTKWQGEWDYTKKGAITKIFFPKIPDRLKLKINVTQNIITMVTGQGNINTYLYKYKTLDSAKCSYKRGEQTIDHILYDCELVEQERDRLKAAVLRSENWPMIKYILINKYSKNF